MSLGSLLLEGDNYELWVALACLSGHKALKHCAFSRGLQYDVSLAVAWACLGKLYRELGDKQLDRQEFDRARSIDPSVALPWIGMSADVPTRESVTDEVYENCLRAVQIMLLAKFQIGLALLTTVSGHLSSSQVFGAIRQAVQHAPYYPKAHNLNGQEAYRFMLYHYSNFSATRDLEKRVSAVGESAGPSVSLICRLFYCIFGLDSAVNSILKMPKALFQSTEVSFIISADHALDQNNRLELVVSSSLSCLSSHEEIMEMHLLIGMSKLVKQGSDDLIDIQSGVGHLKKAFHLYPNSTSIRHINFISGLLETILRLTFWHTLCRVHAAIDNYINPMEEYMRCLNLQTDYPVGWMCFKFIESRYDLQDEVNSVMRGSQNMWMAMSNLLLGLISAWAQDLVHVEELTGKACSLVAWLVRRAASSYATVLLVCTCLSQLQPSVLSLIYLWNSGAICLELARKQRPEYLYSVERFLQFPCLLFLFCWLKQKEAWVLRRSGRRTFVWKALLGHQNITSLLTHYGESSNGLACMFYSVIKPAEIYFQMYLLEKQSTDGSQPSSGTYGNEIPQRWILKAIHLHPSCSRYWKALLNYVDWIAEM
ncbi:hypothetical protein Ancab_036953 [Ancistrocladus abbreviatus]